jgi:pilus assembly protein CpaB
VSSRRRAAALLGLALVLGTLAASDVSRRESALRRQVGRPVPVVVVRTALHPGDRITRAALAVREVPERYAPAAALHDPGEATGRRLAVAVDPGSDLDPAMFAVPGRQALPTGPALRRGERAMDLVAVGAPDAVVPGARVDVLVTYDGGSGAPGATRIALSDVEVLTVRAAAPAEGTDPDAGLPRVQAALRVGVRQAVGLAGAVAAAHEVRLLARPR